MIFVKINTTMNFLKTKTSWSNAELIVLKLAIASAYIIIGAYFSTIISNYYTLFIILFVVTVVWSMYMWLSKMKK